MANFTEVFSKLDALDASVAAVQAKIDELKTDGADQTEVDAVGARVEAAKAALDSAVA